MTDLPDTQHHTGPDQTLRRVRSIAAIAALATTTVALVVLIIAMASLYPPLKRTVDNLEAASAAAATAAGDFAAISDATSQNLAETSVNLNQASVNFNTAAENLERNSEDDSLAEAIVEMLTAKDGQIAR